MCLTRVVPCHLVNFSSLSLPNLYPPDRSEKRYKCLYRYSAYKTWGRRHNLDWIAQVDSENMTHIIACTQTEQFGPSLFRSSEQGRNNGTGGCHWKGQNRSLQKTADEKPAMIVRPHISQ